MAFHLGAADQFYENMLGILDKMFQQTPDVSMGRSLHCILINKKNQKLIWLVVKSGSSPKTL